MSKQRQPVTCARFVRGFSLVETLGALAIGLFVVAVAITLYARAGAALRVLDAHARMHETARHILAVIEADVRMAGYYGLARTAENVSIHTSFAFPDKCGGPAWVTDVERFVDGANNQYLGATNCAALSGGAQAGSDVLVVRRASARPIELSSTVVPAAARDEVLLISTREAAQLFVATDIGGVIPAGYAVAAAPGMGPPSELRSLLVHAYYVSVDSSAGESVPALRRKTLTGGPGVGDEEIGTGVEDLQFHIGADVDGDGILDSFFDPGTLPAAAIPRCIRIWLRVRGVERSGTTAASAGISYADRTWPAVNDGYDRMLVTKTIQIRNSHP
jgi:type IV pilus assembly protein PilW